MTEQNKIIVATNLTKRFGSLTAVNAIDFSISDGECFGFLGPNGAGKTTAMRMIYCLSPITAGQITIMGMNPRHNGAEIKSFIGVVAQDNNLDLELTVRENLIIYSRFFGIPSRVARERIDRLVNFMALEDKIHSRIKELSGGMKRRLVLVRALLNNPRILILDEPTTGLDPQVRHLIWEKLRELKSSGVTMLLTTHYMDEASQLCDRLVIMNEGNILLQGNPHQLVEKNTPKYVMEFSVNGGNNNIDHITNQYDCHIELYGNRYYVYARSERILEDIIKQHGITQRIIRNSTLEDLFLKLTGRAFNE